MKQSSIENRWLNAFLTTACVTLVAIVCAGMNGGISIGASNHVGLLPVVRRILNPHYLPNDFNIGLRFFHHRVFAYLIAGLTALLDENRALLILHIIGILFFSSALYWLCRQFELSRSAFLVVGGMLATGFAWTGWGFEENDFLGNAEIQPPLFANAFTMLLLAALMRERYRLAACLAGCVVLFHLQIGVIVTLMILPIYIGKLRQFGGRELIAMFASYVVPALPAVLHLWGMLQRGLLRPAAQVHSLASYIDFRHPHHFALMSRAHAYWLIAHCSILLAAYQWAKNRNSDRTKSLSVLLVSSTTLLVLSIIHFTDYYLIHQDKFANIQVIRVSPLITVLGAIAFVWWVNQVAITEKRQLMLNLIWLVVLVAWGYRVSHQPEAETDFAVRYYSDESDKRGLKKEWVNMCNWIRINGPMNTNYLTPPANDGFTALSDRSNIAEFKINPDGALKMHEWYERLTDLTGGNLPNEKGFANRQPLNQAYGELSERQMLMLAQKYQAGFAVVPKNAKLPFNVLYQNKSLKLVAIPLH